ELADKLPEDREVYKFLYSCHKLILKKEKVEKSWEIIKKFIEFPWVSYPRVWTFMAQINFANKLPSLEERIEWLRKCVEILPLKFSCIAEGKIIFLLSRNAKEEKDYKKVAEEYERYFPMLKKLGKRYALIDSYYKCGKIYEEKIRRANERAAQMYENAIKIDPTHPVAEKAKKALENIR
ncbi:hypothetical protein J7L87_04795, partial [bacterium]|nr:hypothetical protein [bacterium]